MLQKDLPTIKDKRIDACGNALATKDAVFSIEFEADNKLLICIAIAETVAEALERLITRIRLDPSYSPSLKDALEQSEYLTVKVEYTHPHEATLHQVAYHFVILNKSYTPYGYNYSYEPTIKAPSLLKEVHQYEAKGGQWVFKKTWPNLASIISYYRTYRPSNISSCINGRIKTAYGYKWTRGEALPYLSID